MRKIRGNEAHGRRSWWREREREEERGGRWCFPFAVRVQGRSEISSRVVLSLDSAELMKGEGATWMVSFSEVARGGAGGARASAARKVGSLLQVAGQPMVCVQRARNLAAAARAGKLGPRAW